MPNWCYNKVSVKHKDTKMIERIVAAHNKEQLLQEFVPHPVGANECDDEADRLVYKLAHGEFDWHDWNTQNWGTKWDIDPLKPAEYKSGQKTAKLEFLTAWSPPEPVFAKWEELGFEINARYSEPGMGFKGTYKTEKLVKGVV